jgi:SAM-dependent methyltransferase
MDAYTTATKEWLDRRYQRYPSGDYLPHQPVHGVEAARDAGVLRDYVRIHRILDALSRLSFESLVDVGAAEGLVAALARELFGADVQTTDLSSEVCARATELFGIRAQTADIHALPFENESVDVVVCSETIEHVTEFERAVEELLRVARVAVVITVPHESPEDVRAERERGEPHAHIHAFDLRSFNGWSRGATSVATYPILSRWSRHPFALLEARAISASTGGRAGDSLRSLYERARPALRRLPAQRAVEALMALDAPLCEALPGHDGVLAVIAKRPEASSSMPRLRVRPADVVGFRARGR